MLVNKLKENEFVTEYLMPIFDHVKSRKTIKDLSKTKIALVTSDGIESSSDSKYGRYELNNMGQTAHRGYYDPAYTNHNPNTVVLLML